MGIEATTVLAEGLLTWPPAERELGRFGTVSVREPDTHHYRRFTGDLIGQVVELAFTITQVRTAVLRPDPRLGAAVAEPRVGARLRLGVGALFVLDLPGLGPAAVGVLPTEERLRPVDWLDPSALYTAQNQHGSLSADPYPGRRPLPYRETPVTA